MKNNRGFTVVEMGVSFCLIFTVCILLFQVVLSLKELYIKSDVETTLLNKQGIILNKMYKDFKNKGVSLATSCGNSCVSFVFLDGDEKQLSTNKSNKTITYDGYVWKLDEASSVGDFSFATGTITGYGTCFKITVPVTNKLIDSKDFGLDVVYGY